MEPTEAFLGQIEELELTRNRLTELGRRKPEGWKKDYANARLALQDQLAALGRTGSAAARARGGEAERRFTETWTRYRSTLSSHQARWPVILLESADDSYRKSISEIDAIFVQLIAQLRSLARN